MGPSAKPLSGWGCPSNPGTSIYVFLVSRKKRRVAVSTAAPSSDKEAQRRRAIVAKLWQITTNFPGLSAKAARIEACPPELRDEYVKQVQARLQSFSLSTLEGSFRTWRRYLIFLASMSSPRRLSRPTLPFWEFSWVGWRVVMLAPSFGNPESAWRTSKVTRVPLVRILSVI